MNDELERKITEIVKNAFEEGWDFCERNDPNLYNWENSDSKTKLEELILEES